MPRSEDLDRTLELPAEHVDDLEPLESTTAGPIEARPDRVQTTYRPQAFDESLVETITESTERQVELRALAIARRDQQHRHAVELAELRHRHEGRRQRTRQETLVMGAVMLLAVSSGLAWIAMPVADAAQIVFTTSFGVVVGYLGGRNRRTSALPS